MSVTTVRMGGYQGPPSVHTRAGHILGREFLARAGDGCRFEFTENVTALGRQATDLFDMTEGDELEIFYFASSYLAHRVPNLAVFDLPFQITSRERIYQQLDGELGRRIARDIEANTGYVLLGYWDNGFRHFSNVRNPIRMPQDCEGLSIRTMDNAIHQATFRALGFDPKYIDVKDYPKAVRTRQVDAQENPLTNTINFNVHHTHPYLTMTGHFYGVTLVLGNRKRIGSWPELARRALQEAIPIATAAQRGFALEEDRTGLKVLAEAGVDVVGPDGFDREAFEKATADVVSRESRSIDPEVVALVRN
jgi:TRAP-type C4-dicarboxylate transport system substrate-binding protein